MRSHPWTQFDRSEISYFTLSLFSLYSYLFSCAANLLISSSSEHSNTTMWAIWPSSFSKHFACSRFLGNPSIRIFWYYFIKKYCLPAQFWLWYPQWAHWLRAQQAPMLRFRWNFGFSFPLRFPWLYLITGRLHLSFNLQSRNAPTHCPTRIESMRCSCQSQDLPWWKIVSYQLQTFKLFLSDF